ncbi:MAG: ABC transporter ATP-binding protein [Ruminiclostridium sp.]|nr:ABC transporter ATP-binding protein [Ruminiclostridium sp.]
MVLTIRDITKYYGNKLALDSFSIELTQGVYGLLGPNGAGKSTLMNIIATLLKPSKGMVFYNGEEIIKMNARYRDKLGYLPQNPGMYKNFSAKRFLLYISALKGLDKNDAGKKAEQLLEMVNLKSEGKRKIGEFSGGMRQRLGIAQALLNDPEILILDEPTAGLDPKERIRFRNIISEISRNRIVILSTHIVSDIEYIAKKVLLIKEGKLLKEELPGNLLKELEGKVWSKLISENDGSYAEKNNLISNITLQNDGTYIRIISPDKPGENAELQTPRFEDIYLYYFGEESEK